MPSPLPCAQKGQDGGGLTCSIHETKRKKNDLVHRKKNKRIPQRIPFAVVRLPVPGETPVAGGSIWLVWMRRSRFLVTSCSSRFVLEQLEGTIQTGLVFKNLAVSPPRRRDFRTFTDGVAGVQRG